MFLPMHFSRRFLPTTVLSTLIGVSVALGGDAQPQYGTTVITHGYQLSGFLPAWPVICGFGGFGHGEGLLNEMRLFVIIYCLC